jgi:hypothetical protein
MGAPSMKQDVSRNVVSNPANWQDSDVIPEEESYVDFRNSALWLAPDSAIPDPNDLQRYEEAQSGGEEQSPIHDTYRSGVSWAMNGNVDEGRTRPTTESPYLPSPPLERERPEFSTARKPLPALPKEDQ